jgi:hypothetical protein
MAGADGTLCVAWQDDRNGTNDVYAKTSLNGGMTFGPEARVDDAGAGPSAQTAPSAAVATDGGTRCFVVWEDTRLGNSDIYLGSRPLP